jgi:tetraacyldisaccharide 4'-kinase
VSSSADSFFQRLWYDRNARWLSLLLLPLSWLFGLIVVARRAAYRRGVFGAVQVGRPTIVIGNITVGGTGKTPFTIWLATQLQSRGLRVGIVLRGYGGRSREWPREVTAESSWEDVGDEAVLLASRTGAIVVAGPDRVADARLAIELGAQIVLSDDGLQHYRLARDREIAVIDARRGLGNGRLLPAGPLREPAERLSGVDLKVVTHRDGASAVAQAGAIAVKPKLLDAVSIATGERRPLQNFGDAPVHAIAAIGHPQGFFDALTAANLTVQSHPLPDHARIAGADICFADDAMVLMTEKDAVKCRAIADQRHWAVRMDIEISGKDAAVVSAMIDRLIGSRPSVN